jgi:hypothetical protein
MMKKRPHQEQSANRSAANSFPDLQPDLRDRGAREPPGPMCAGQDAKRSVVDAACVEV